MLLHFLVADLVHLENSVSAFGGVLRVDVQVLEDDGLTERGLVVDPRTPIPMSAGPNFEVEGTVHLILLRSENGGKILRHDGQRNRRTLSLQRVGKNGTSLLLDLF